MFRSQYITSIYNNSSIQSIMKSQKKITTREKAVIVYSLLFPETEREELFRAAYDGSDEEFD